MGTSEVESGLLALSEPPSPDCSGRIIQSSLVTLRRHLGMEVGFIGRFDSGCRFFDYVDADALDCPVQLRGSDPLEQTYCGRVAEGLVPGIIPDAAREPGVADLAITQRLEIGAYMSVPLRRATGEVLGTICCFSHQPDHSLRERDLDLMRLFAELVSAHLETLLAHEERVGRVRAGVNDLIARGGPSIVVQPIVVIETGEVIGHEALSRFDTGPGPHLGPPGMESWDPSRWFAEANRAGVGPELEASAVANALALLPSLPDGTLLSVNVSGLSLSHAPLFGQLVGGPARRLVVEITEHVPVESYAALADPIREIRAAGGRLAVDDAGAGYAGLEHILQLAPELVKLDRCLITGVTQDPARQAMIRALGGFAAQVGIDVVAEGVEEPADARTLHQLGVRLGQGYHFGRPAPVGA